MNQASLFIWIAWTFMLVINFLEYAVYKKNKKLKTELSSVLDNLQKEVNHYHKLAQLAGFTVKKAQTMQLQLLEEQKKIRETNQFVIKAVEEKVKKKKIRGKKRRKNQ